MQVNNNTTGDKYFSIIMSLAIFRVDIIIIKNPFYRSKM